MKSRRLTIIVLISVVILVGAGVLVFVLLNDSGDETVLATLEPGATEYDEFDPGAFDNPTTINGPWFPLRPGTQYVYDGVTLEDGEQIEHQVIFTITDLIKVIEGIPTIVIWDQDFSDGELVETEIAFFAQDNDGNVWQFGEYPEEYEDGEFIETAPWISGLDDARAGIHIKAIPEMGAVSYAQGWGPGVDWTDRTQVYQMDQETCVPLDCYEGVLVMDEYNREEVDVFQLKYYAPDVGLVRVGWRGNEEAQEDLQLIEIVELDSEALAEARAAAIALEQHGFEVSDVYKQTLPLEPNPDVVNP